MFNGKVNKNNFNYQSMKKLVITLLGAAFLTIGMNIADLKNVPLPTTVQTVAASTVQQPMTNLFGQMKCANPDTVHDTVRVEKTVPCNHKQLSVKTIVKRTTIKKADTSYVPLLYIVEPGDKVDSTNHDLTIRKGELRDYIQIASNVRK